MTGFVLAAGEGRRLQPLTDDVPKPMIRIAGHPVLEYNVRMLVAAGITEIIINCHHRADVIRDYFGDGTSFGARILYSYEPVLRGTSGALGPFREELTETFVVVYGDNVTALNFRDFVKAHDSSSIATIALLRRRNAGASGVVDLDGRNRITAFVEKPKLEPLSERWVNAGYLVVEPRIFEYIPAHRPSDFGMEVLPAALLAGEAMRAFPLHDPVWWIDSVEDYERVSADTRLAALASAWR